MIDPIHSLAFSIQASRGVYAVFVGSGVSRGAKIPTGWEVTLDLIRKLARLEGEEADPDPEGWYREKFKKEADYSEILKNLAKTSAERQQLLRAYWEPNEQEREDGEKQPTAAHRAIASLCAQRFVRVILTTNFDRLLEIALREQGVEPTILSTPDQVAGALPLIHMDCCVFKVHGDYLDTRIKNTPAELAEYPPEFDRLLDRIFDEFGLVVCGWSAEWDGALRSALERAPSRRFTTYWAVPGEPGDQAQRLIHDRRAEVIHIEDADSFFGAVAEHVRSIEDFSTPHPLSTEAAVASLKRYLPDPRYRIQLSDLLHGAVERVVEVTSGREFAVEGGPTPDKESVTARVRHYEAACSTLLAMATVGGFWAEEEHQLVWERAIQRLGSLKSGGGLTVWLELRRYPATLLLYALGLGALAADRLRFVGHLFAVPLHDQYGEQAPAVSVLPPYCLCERCGQKKIWLLGGMENSPLPLNDWIHDTLRPYVRRIIPDDENYGLVFDKLEILVALGYARRRHDDGDLPPVGAFTYRHSNRSRIMNEIKESLSQMQNESSFVTSDLFGETKDDCEKCIVALEDAVRAYNTHVGIR